MKRRRGVVWVRSAVLIIVVQCLPSSAAVLAGEERAAVRTLLADLCAPDAAKRARAARMLRATCPGNRDVLKGVRALLKHKNPGVRADAAELLGKLVIGDGHGILGRSRRRMRPGRLHGHRSERAVKRALDWLARFQDRAAGGEENTAGRWDAGGLAKHAGGESLDGKGEARFDIGVTGLALLAFLGAGYTDRGDDRYRDTVAEGLTFLLRSQAQNGCLGPHDLARRTTNHAVAALVLIEAWVLTADPKYREAAQGAVAFLERSLTTSKAWGYVHGDHLAPDTHTTGWVLTVLGLAQRAGLDVDEQGIHIGLKWLASMRDQGEFPFVGYEKPGLRVSYGGYEWRWEEFLGKRRRRLVALSGSRAGLFLDRERHQPAGSHGLAMWCMLMLKPKRRSEMTSRGLELIRGEWPNWRGNDDEVDMCSWAYCALAVAQAEDPRSAGKMTVRWFDELHAAVLPKQRTDGVAAGSWDPVGPWGSAGGRVYATAMVVRALEAPYLYGMFGAFSKPARAAIVALRRVAIDEAEHPAVRERAKEALRWVLGD